eukprot:scaffold200680_cov43-Prasinocladus_malaysianus.AAC.1
MLLGPNEMRVFPARLDQRAPIFTECNIFPGKESLLAWTNTTDDARRHLARLLDPDSTELTVMSACNPKKPGQLQ